ncbi:MAG: tyrosine-type recombinase/integrase [Bdellovibrionales bacterium]|nr:tyrosine-type recombinase/integrase [Bdellovibrionales bacterium]
MKDKNSDVIFDQISKYLEFVKNSNNYSSHTYQAYKRDLSQFLGRPVDKPIYEKVNDNSYVFGKLNTPLSNEDENLIFELAKKASLKWGDLAPASQNRKVATLKSFTKWLYENDIINKDISLLLHLRKVPQRIPNYLSADECIQIARHLKVRVDQSPSTHEELSAVREWTLFTLLYGGGLRISEACSAEWKNCDLSRSILRVKGKGGKERVVPLPFKLSRIDLRAQHLVYPQLPVRKAFDIVRNWGSEIGLSRPIHPHALRHSYATHLLTSGADLRSIQELLGHTSIAATQKYTHLSLADLQNTMEKHHPIEKK